MVANFYLLVLIISIVMSAFFMIRNKKIDSIYAVFALAVTCNAMGRFMLAKATTVSMALFATKAMYLGCCYMPIIITIMLARMCNIKASRLLKGTILFYATVIFTLVMTVEHHDLYYKSVKLVKGEGFNYLIKEYGPCHKLYSIMLILFCILLVYYIVVALKNRLEVSYKVVITLCTLSGSIFITYLIERLFKSNISYLSIGYLIAVILMGMFFDRVNRYDMTANIVYSVERMKEYGYIAFDNKNRYVGSNDYVKEIFPEIKKWQIDVRVEKSDSYLYKEVLSHAMSLDVKDNNSKNIKVNDKFYELKCRDIYYKESKKVGYILEFIDRTAENKYINAMKDYNNLLEEEVAERLNDYMYVKDMIILGMADLVESRDSNTGGHIKRTSEVIRVFSTKLKDYKEEFGINNYFLKCLAKAAPMHDLGKIAIDDKVLRKKGKYTDAEFNEMKKHTTEGARIVKQILENVEDIEFYNIIKNVAHYHHEKWNGQGYPKGLAGEDIPLEARIMALADVFDALVSKRCYKEAFSYDKAFSIIKESLGEHFDPKLGKIFLECRPILEELYDNYKKEESNIERGCEK